MEEKDALIINHLRSLSIDMISQANSGHTGIALGAANIIYTLYSRHMNISTMDATWINRDRFIMSAGHGSALLYANLYLAGYNISIEDLKKFRQLGSKTPGHPETKITPGVDFSTGPLGQGLASAVGVAIGEAYLNQKYRLPGKNLMDKPRSFYDFNTYVLASDGDLMEGLSYEACSLAGHLGLGKLIVLYDSNNLTLDGNLSNCFSENIKERFESMGWHYQLVEDDNNINAIDDAIFYAKEELNKPSIIEVKTILGKYSKLQGTSKAHGAVLNITDINAIKRSFNIDIEPFNIDPRVREIYKDNVYNRTSLVYNNWSNIYNEYMKSDRKDDIKELEQLITGDLNIPLDMLNISSSFLTNETLRQSNMRVMETLSYYCPNLLGGNADVGQSSLVSVSKSDYFSKTNRQGKNIAFGVREHAMGAIMNGIGTLNITTFGSTFLAFSDYLKPAIRTSAMMGLPVIYIFTHDSISIGEDGPSHQPIEQLDTLRNIPNLDVYRPANVSEISGCWINILKRRRPAVLILSKSTVDEAIVTNSNYVSMGAYPIVIEKQRPSAIIVASGSEVSLANGVINILNQKGYEIRLVSMVSKELFEEQDVKYKQQVLPLGIKTFIIEASTAASLEKYASGHNYLINIEQFGLSGSSLDVLNHFNFTKEKIAAKIESMIKN